MKKELHVRITESADKWLSEQVKAQGISKGTVIQMLINEAMKRGRVQT